jgi:hypothetical protein
MIRLYLFSTFLFSFFLNAQNKDSLKIENKKLEFQYKKTFIPVGSMAAGLLSLAGKNNIDEKIVKQRNKNFLNFENHADDYLQFTPFAAVYAFEWFGMKPRTDFKNRTAILVKGQIINLGTVYLLKKITDKTRPDGTSLSFPSGHTAEAFAGATLLCIEYGENYEWVPYAAYTVASGVGIMRILNNKHYASDVLFGAGIGIISTKIAYWTHKYKWNNNKQKTYDPFEKTIYKQINTDETE